jgi:hypothetical protein
MSAMILRTAWAGRMWRSCSWRPPNAFVDECPVGAGDELQEQRTAFTSGDFRKIDAARGQDLVNHGARRTRQERGELPRHLPLYQDLGGVVLRDEDAVDHVASEKPADRLRLNSSSADRDGAHGCVTQMYVIVEMAHVAVAAAVAITAPLSG